MPRTIRSTTPSTIRDVPIQQSKYVPYSPGTEPNDVVHMIRYVTLLLADKNPKKRSGVDLTKTEALWLLAHLVGDIHQPLHVGAVYFDKQTCATIVDPNNVPGGMANVVSTNRRQLDSVAGRRARILWPFATSLPLLRFKLLITTAAAGLSSALVPDAFTTLPHFSVSSANSLPKSAGEPGSTRAAGVGQPCLHRGDR